MVDILSSEWVPLVLSIISIIGVHRGVVLRRSIMELKRGHAAESVTLKPVARHLRRGSHLDLMVWSHDIHWHMLIMSWFGWLECWLLVLVLRDLSEYWIRI